MADDFDALVLSLRGWGSSCDAHKRAAVELLIWHEHWLRRSDFLKACTFKGRELTNIKWGDARAFVDAGPQASTSQLAILDLAVALGEDRYKLASMGAAHSRSIANAMSAACGLGEIAP